MPRESLRADLVLFARFPPEWNHIGPLREYLEASMKAREKGARAERAVIVLQELLENAVKYSLPSCTIELEVYMRTSGPLEICVTNQASPARLELLARELPVTRGDSAAHAFANALARLKSLPSSTSMLGLARIAMTATLESEVKGNRVTMRARVN